MNLSKLCLLTLIGQAAFLQKEGFLSFLNIWMACISMASHPLFELNVLPHDCLKARSAARSAVKAYFNPENYRSVENPAHLMI